MVLCFVCAGKGKVDMEACNLLDILWSNRLVTGENFLKPKEETVLVMMLNIRRRRKSWKNFCTNFTALFASVSELARVSKLDWLRSVCKSNWTWKAEENLFFHFIIIHLQIQFEFSGWSWKCEKLITFYVCRFSLLVFSKLTANSILYSNSNLNFKCRKFLFLCFSFQHGSSFPNATWRINEVWTCKNSNYLSSKCNKFKIL